MLSGLVFKVSGLGSARDVEFSCLGLVLLSHGWRFVFFGAWVFGLLGLRV